MKKAIVLTIIILLFPIIISQGKTALVGYHLKVMYPYPIKPQVYSTWCAFAALASYPGLLHFEKCDIANQYFTHLRHSNVNCCGLSNPANLNICVESFAGIQESEFVGLTRACGLSATKLYDYIEFFGMCIQNPSLSQNKIPALMSIDLGRTGHAGLFCGAQIVYTDYNKKIDYIVLVWGNPATGIVLEEVIPYERLLSLNIYVVY